MGLTSPVHLVQLPVAGKEKTFADTLKSAQSTEKAIHVKKKTYDSEYPALGEDPQENVKVIYRDDVVKREGKRGPISPSNGSFPIEAQPVLVDSLEDVCQKREQEVEQMLNHYVELNIVEQQVHSNVSIDEPFSTDPAEATSANNEESDETFIVRQQKFRIVFVNCHVPDCTERAIPFKYWKLKQHLKQTHQLKPRLCPYGDCLYRLSFNTNEQLDQHFAQCHSDFYDWICRECLEQFPEPSPLCTHLHQFHYPGLFQCVRPNCEAMFPNRAAANQHFHQHQSTSGPMKSATNWRLPVPPPPILNEIDDRFRQISIDCPVCWYRCWNDQLLVEHMRTEHDQTPYQCLKCDAPYTHRYQLFAHVDKAHPKDRDWPCPECPHRPRPFYSVKDLIHHQYFQHANGMFACLHEDCRKISAESILSTPGEAIAHYVKNHPAADEIRNRRFLSRN